MAPQIKTETDCNIFFQVEKQNRMRTGEFFIWIALGYVSNSNRVSRDFVVNRV